MKGTACENGMSRSVHYSITKLCPSNPKPHPLHVFTCTIYTPVECPSTGGPHTREWVLTDIADSTQLGTRERGRAKVVKNQATHTATVTGDGRREKSERRVWEAERRAMEAERRAMKAERRAREIEEASKRVDGSRILELQTGM